MIGFTLKAYCGCYVENGLWRSGGRTMEKWKKQIKAVAFVLMKHVGNLVWLLAVFCWKRVSISGHVLDAQQKSFGEGGRIIQDVIKRQKPHQ